MPGSPIKRNRLEVGAQAKDDMARRKVEMLHSGRNKKALTLEDVRKVCDVVSDGLVEQEACALARVDFEAFKKAVGLTGEEPQETEFAELLAAARALGKHKCLKMLETGGTSANIAMVKAAEAQLSALDPRWKRGAGATGEPLQIVIFQGPMPEVEGEAGTELAAVDVKESITA